MVAQAPTNQWHEEDLEVWVGAVAAARQDGDLSRMVDFVESKEGEGRDDRPAPLGLRGLLFDEPDDENGS